MWAGYEAQHGSVRIADVHRDTEVPAIMDLAVLNTELIAARDDDRHLIFRPEHERAYVEPIEDRTASAVSALAQTNDEPRFMVGKDHSPDVAVLEEFVGQLQIKQIGVPPGTDCQVAHRQLDLADADDGELHDCSVSNAPRRAERRHTAQGSADRGMSGCSGT